MVAIDLRSPRRIQALRRSFRNQAADMSDDLDAGIRQVCMDGLCAGLEQAREPGPIRALSVRERPV
jgi:hypothetical protein